jgi:hypothetical protein
MLRSLKLRPKVVVFGVGEDEILAFPYLLIGYTNTQNTHTHINCVMPSAMYFEYTPFFIFWPLKPNGRVSCIMCVFVCIMLITFYFDKKWPQILPHSPQNIEHRL